MGPRGSGSGRRNAVDNKTTRTQRVRRHSAHVNERARGQEDARDQAQESGRGARARNARGSLVEPSVGGAQFVLDDDMARDRVDLALPVLPRAENVADPRAWDALQRVPALPQPW